MDGDESEDSIKAIANSKKKVFESSNEPSEEDYDSEDEYESENEDSFEAKYGEKRIEVLSEKQWPVEGKS